MIRRAQSWLLALTLLGFASAGQAQEDDWSITRPEARPRVQRPLRARPARPRVRTPSAVRPEREATSAQRMVERYLAIVLVRAEDETAMQRLLEHAARLPEGVRGLQRDLSLRRAESTNMRLVLASLAQAQGDESLARAMIQEAMTLEPQRVEPYRLLARIERSSGNLEASLAALRAAHERAPREDALLREQGALLVELRRFDEARAAYEALGGTSAWGRTEFVRLLASRGQCREALPAFEGLDSALDQAETTTLLLLRARCEDEVGDAQAAQASLMRALSSARRVGRELEVLDAMLELARRHGTLEGLLPVVASLGASARASLGTVLEELGRDAEARAAYVQHLRARPRDADVRMRLSHLLARSGELEAALAERRSLAQLYPDRLAFTLEYAEALNALGRTAEALRVLDAARTRGRRDAGVLRRLLDAYSRMGNQERVLSTLQALVADDPSDASRVTALASELLARGETSRAQSLIDALAEDGSVEGELAAGRASLDARLMDAARAHLERAIALRPDDPEVLDASADLYERMGRSAEAQRVLETRLSGLAAGDPRARDLEARLVASWARGGVLPQQLEPLGARTEAGDLRALSLLAEVQRRLGDHEGARASLTRLEALTPDDAHVVSALQRLHHARHDYAAEVRALRRLVVLEPSRAGWHLSQLVELALSVYRDDDALAFANEAGSRAFGDAGLAIRLGRLEAQRNEPARAAALYARALEVDPDAHEAAWELASLEETQGHVAQAARLYASIVERTSDDELRDRAAQASLESARASGTLAALEPRFLAVALAHGDSPAHRRPALILYSALLHELARGEPESLERAATRALPVLLAAVRDTDASHRAMSQSLLLRFPVRGAAMPLLALAASESADLALRRAAAFAALRVVDAGHEGALRALLGALDARLRIAGLHGLLRVLSPDASSSLLASLRAHPDLEVRTHAHAWSTLSLGGTTRDDAALPESTRLRVLAQASAPNSAALDWLATHALSQPSSVGARHPLLVSVQLDRVCAPRIDANETLDAWLTRAVAVCPTTARPDALVAEALERAVYQLTAAALPNALMRLGELGAVRPEVVMLAARALHTRLGPTPSLRDAQRDLQLIRSAPETCSEACWDRYLAHPLAEVRASAVEIAPEARAVAMSDAAWLVRRARVARLAAGSEATAPSLREALEDESLYVREAALAALAAHPDAATCAAFRARLTHEPSASFRVSLTRALGSCNTQH